jgi:hypothetical protein
MRLVQFSLLVLVLLTSTITVRTQGAQAQDDARVKAFLQHVRQLPSDATAIYG